MSRMEERLCWVELIARAPDRHALSAARIQPVNTGPRTCLAITFGGRWLSSAHGLPTCFRDLDSARKFLDMVGIEGHEVATTPADIGAHCRSGRQCFSGNASGLHFCFCPEAPLQ